MPPPRQYPGLGPLPEALGVQSPGTASPETRAAGLDMLRRGGGSVPSLMEVLLGMADPRQKLEEAYYGVPMGPSLREQFSDRVTHGLNEALGRPEDLGPSASGRAEPTITDAQMMNYIFGGPVAALAGPAIGAFARTQGPMRMGASPAEAERYNMEGVGGGVENLIPDPRDPRSRHTLGILPGSLPFNFQ